MKTELDSFTQSHLIQWLKWKHGNNLAQNLELIDSFLSDMDEQELKYWLGLGWRVIIRQAKLEHGKISTLRNDWRKIYPMNFGSIK